MPDAVETMAYAADTGVPWHRLGTSVKTAQTSEQMIKAAGLGWRVRTVALQTIEGDLVNGKRAVVREGNLPEGGERVLGVVGAGYEPVMNAECFDFVDGLVADGTVVYDTAGSLKGGRVVWALARMQDDWRIADDIHQTYIAITTGHDGGLSIAAMPTDVRIVCANTHHMAFGAKGERAMVRIRHTTSVRERMAEAQKLMRVTTESQRRYQQWLEQIAQIKIDDAQERAAVEEIIKEIFGDAEKAETLRVENRIKRDTNAFKSSFLALEIMRSGPTAYALLNAFTGFADHALKYQGSPVKQEEMRFSNSVILGRGTRLKEKATNAIVELTGAAF